MKTLLILIVIIFVGYFVYVNFIAAPEKETAKKVEQKVFEQPYSQIAVTRQVEAKQYAASFINKEATYFAMEGEYTANLKKLGFSPRLGQFYKAKGVSADEQNFLIEIRGNIDKDGTIDVWEVDKDGYRNVINDVTR